MGEPMLRLQDELTDRCLEKIWRWNSSVPEATEDCVHDLFTEQARERPDAPAVCAWDGDLTYGELDVLSTKLAGYLVQLGVKPEDMVPLCFEKSMWTVVAMLAVLKANGGFVPLDPEHPQIRQREILKQTGAAVVLVSVQYSALWADTSPHIVTVSAAFIKQLPTIVNTSSLLARPTNAAYVMFTSGSTGIPKGVVLEHRAVSTSCLSHGRAYGMTDCTRALQFTAYTFDFCIAEIITTLLYGGCICIPSDSGRHNDLSKAINTMKVNWALLTPSVARLLDPDLVPSLRILVMGGEQVNSADWDRWPSSVQTINGYGPTECCIVCTGYTSEQGFTTGTIGTSIASISWVVDPKDHNRLAPLGSIGELLVEGPILARGYLNDPEKTAAVFIDDPPWLLEGWAGHDGRQGRLYKTGDLVRYNANGNLVCLGRKDSQVKLRGQRVELGEVEHHVRGCLPEAKQLAVEVVLPLGQKNHATLAAFVQLDKDTRTHNALLKEKVGGDDSMAQVVFLTRVEEELAKRLPEYMVPTVFFSLLHFPTTTSGKTDRKRLREIGASFTAQQLAEMRTSSQGPKRQPSTQAEQTMQQLWAQVLSIELENIGLDDSFFRLGGDSIAAIKLVGEARRTGLQLSVADIFRHPTLAALASLETNQCNTTIEETLPFSLLGENADVAQVRDEAAAMCSVDGSAIKDMYLCSPLQEGLMSLTAKRAGDYIMQDVLELRADVDEHAFHAAWEHVVQSTAVLRTRIVQHSEIGLLQVVVEEKMQWTESESLEEYLREDKAVSMGVGDPLARYALIKEPYDGGKRWFVWTMHHALYDGWSLPWILHAVKQVYSGAVLERQPSFNAFIQYLSQQDPEAADAYWQTALVDCEAILFPPLPSTVTQPVADTTVDYQCPPLSQSATDITTSTLVRASWAIVTSRYISSDDVVFGTTVTGRNAPIAGVEAMVGPTIATVPLRVCLQKDQTVSTLLECLQQQATEMIAHEQTGLQRIIKMGPGPQHACSFQTLLVVQPADNVLGSEDMLGEWRGHSELQDFTTYALIVQCTLAAEGVHITASFDARVVEEWVVEKMLRQFGFVMQQLAEAGEEKKVADIETTTLEDRKQLWAWNQDVPPEAERCIHDLFTEQAASRPNSPAICAWDGELTYGELDALSSKLAGHLVQLGIKPEDMVPLCFEKSMWTVVAMLAVLKAGGAFVPLDPDHPATRHEDIFRQTGAKVMIASAQHSARWTGISHQVVTVSAGSLEQLSTLANTDSLPTNLKNAAYVIFTSGSTGIPKGVVLEHGAVVTSCLGHGQAFGITNLSRVLQFASYTFDACIAEIITTLLCGGCICVPSESDRRNDLAKAISTMDVNWSFLTPSVARLLDPGLVPSLKILAIGGEQSSSADWNRWPGSVQKIHVYGPTECCIFCTGYTSEQGFEPSTIGTSVASVSWMVDPENHERLAPLGSMGELLVEGPILARGYLNDVNKTEAAFINDPVWLLEGYRGHAGRRGRLYKTGDLVRYDVDGNLVYLGRKDSQIKVRGQRVELGDIEHHVRECLPEAKQLAVEMIVPEGEGGHAMLAAFVQLDDNTRDVLLVNEDAGDDSTARVIFLAGVEEELAKRLPKHMVPTVFFALLHFPTTTSGKTDRKRLREIGASFTSQQLAEMRTSSQGPKRQPSTEAEQTMQQLWARVLHIEADNIGMDDSFFRLGGDSIAAMKLVGEARRMRLQLFVADIFQHPKLAALATRQTTQCSSAAEEVPSFSLLGEEADVAQVGKEVAVLCSVDTSLIEDVYPCSPLQEGLMSLTAKRAGDYIMQSVLELRDDVDEDAFCAAWEHVVQSTAALRTRIVQHNELGLLQVVVEEKVEWGESESLEKYLQEGKSASMELGDRLARYALVKESYDGGKHWFVWTIHHALYDGWSLPRILHAVKQVYSGVALERQPSFNAFIQYLGQQNQKDVTSYWQSALVDFEATLFPPLPSSVKQSAADTIVRYQCPPLSQSAANTTISTLIRAAWALVASRYSSSDDVVFGATTTGRNAPVAGIDAMLGPTIATMPVRVRVQSDQTVSAFLEFLQKQATDMIAYEQTGLQHIAKMGPGARHACGFQTLLIVQPTDDVLSSDDTFGEWHNRSELQDFTTYAIMVQCTLAAEGVQITASFDARVIERWVVEKVLSHFGFVMQQLAEAGEEKKLAGIGTTTAEDRQQLWAWNADMPPVTDRCVHDLFAEQARAQPDAPAVCAWDGELTYGELDALSNRLAVHLVQIGVKPEDVVPLCFEKSMWTVVAMLAVLKAGGAFLLLDPSLPAERLKSMCRKVGSTHALASGVCLLAVKDLVGEAIVVDKKSLLQMQTPDRGLPSTLSTSTAYVIFTSGSTGEPKGCKIEHRSSCTAIVQHGPSLQMSTSTRVLQFGSYSFAGCLVEMLHSLVHGGCICIPSEAQRRVGLASVMSRMAVNWAFLTPTVLDTISGPESVPSLKTLCIGGESIQDSQIQQWGSCVHLRQTYGSSEASGVVSSARLASGSTTKDVGKASTAVYWIVDADDHDRLIPLGATGELLVEGAVLGRGYTDDVEKTAATFIEAPAWRSSFDNSHSRLYKTGDLARYKNDGSIELLGRKDTQVKLRGQRIELGEIEHQARLSAAVGVKGLAVELIRPKDKDNMLVCFMAIENKTGGQEETGDEAWSAAHAQAAAQTIRDRLEQFLPQYMVPALFVPLAQLPTISSLKVDRKRLREIGASFTAQQLAEMQTSSQGPKRQPSTEAERTMQRLWARVLSIEADSIGLDDSFFRLGGDSIAAMKLVGEARQTGLQLSVADIFRHPKLAELAGRDTQQCSSSTVEEVPTFSLLGEDVDTAQVREEVAAMCSIDASIVEDVYPCTPLQEGLMSLTAKRAGDYIMQSVLELQADVDEDAFCAAWEHVVQSTAALRTRIVQHNELGLLQVVVEEKIQWTESEALEEYLKEDKAVAMGLGDRLARYALVKKPYDGGKRWFAWTIHHALYDGGSLPLILHAVKQVYSGAVLERQTSFNAFIQYLGQQDLEATAAYWQTALSDCEAVLFPPLPSTVTQPVADTTVEYQCPPLSKATLDTTTSTIIRAAWAIVTSCYTSSDDVVFGTTVTGRNAPIAGVEAMVGPTIATVPVRLRVQRDQTVFAFLQGLQQQSTDMIAHEQAGLQHIAKLGSGPRHACGFQTLLVVQPVDDVLGNDDMLGEWRSYSKMQDFTTYALMVQFTLAAEGVQITASFDARVIEHWVLEKMLRQFSCVMQQLAEAGEEKKVADIDTTTPQDRQQLWAWNADVPPAIERCVHDLFAEQARARPGAPAICAWDGELTYGELDVLSSNLAGHLVQLGVKPEDIVPLCFEKSMWTVVAMLAVLKAGGAFVPLDPDHPTSRHEEILKQTSAKVVLASAQYATIWTSLGRSVVIVSEASTSQLPVVTNAADPSVNPGNAAYAIFTSGSTGIPKGVVLEHKAVATSCLGHGQAFGITDHARVLQFASYTFDACIAEIITTLLCGGCICVPSDSDRRNSLAKAITAMDVNWTFLTPSIARLLTPTLVPSLKILAMGGEQVTSTDWDKWQSSVQVINGYGPTECCVFCVGYSSRRRFSSGVIGKSVASVSWVVDPKNHHKLAPIGSIGELLVEGPILARGYLNDMEKTKAAFIDDPAWLLEGHGGHNGRQGRLYKTGDLVQYDADGNLVCLGRKDSQVKLRGQRVELGEVEHHVRECLTEAKQLAVEVIAPKGEGNHAMLAAFIRLGGATRVQQVRNKAGGDDLMAQVVFLAGVEEELTKRLPKHMVPTVFFALLQFPTTTSGKTDRKRLREMGASFTAQQLAEMRTSSQGPKRQPSTEAERTMQQLWSRVLGIEPDSIGLDDSFFRLGGDSITAMKLVGEARRAGLQLGIADVFRHPKLGAITSSVSREDGSPSTSTIQHVNYAGPVQQSFAQGRLWFLEELYPGLNWYLMPFAVRIRGPLQLAALNAALLATESRHETLRTTFASDGGVNVQVVQPFRAKQLNVIEVPSGDEHDCLEAVQRDQMTPFNLRTEPGWRVSVYQCNKDDHVLSIVMHHIVSDGWSVDILMRELSTFYAASLQGQDPLSQVQPLPIQYRNFSVWQRQQAQIEEQEKQLSYWLTQLQTSRPAELLSDKPRPATLSGKADTRTVHISGPVYARLQQFCNAHGVTLFVALLAVFRATHFRLTGQDDATIGTVNANRDRWELKDMIGFFVNMQCLRITVVEESFEELVQQVQAVVVASLANQDVPFESIVSKLNKDRDLSRHPIVQLAFVVHSQQNLGQLILEGLETESLDGPATSRFDLEFHFYQKPDGLQGDVVFSTDLYAPETIENMLSVFNNVLERCLQEPTMAITSLPLSTDADYVKLDQMGLIQVEETAYPRDSSIVDVFRQQVSACPSRIAVKDSTQEMTYSQLDKASDDMAWWLQRRSLAPETLVGVFANRSCETIVAFLGIMKASLAYLPFDIKIPGKRMETVLRSLPGQKIVLLGNNVQPSDIELGNVEFIHITKALDEGADDRSGSLLGPSATSLAYVMFTSGSTGQPKGVMVEHRGVVRLVRDNNIVQHLPVSRVIAHVANLAFDASTWEIYVSILNGGTLVCIDTMTALDPVAMLQTVRNYEITMALLPPALLRQYVSESPAVVAALGLLCVGGEALHPRDFFAAERIMKGKLINCYGPTENTVISTSFVLTKDEKYTNGVPIGRALSNSGAYVMDPELQLVPLGVIGELVVTGDGVARGYTDPQRNISRFVSVEIAGKKVKAYRTGDYVRHRPTDGQLEFFGRMDGQVKIRGQRIELGEIEHLLRSHNAIREAVAVLQQLNGDKAQLAGFVTVHEGTATIDEQPNDGDVLEHTDAWEEHFDLDFYLPISNVLPENIGRDFVGWTSMYDGSEINKTEMNEWLDDTIATMRNGRRPGHVLEIGSGTGMILFNLGDELQTYIGLDPSRNAVNFVEKTARSMPALAGRVRMHKATAADVGQLERPIAANLVVTNSVVQYFPSQDYLFKVVQELVVLESVQTLFFGDIRSYALYQEFLATRALHIAGNKTTKAELRRMMADMERVERELLVDPAFFTALPSRLPDLVEHVEILPKKMKATNELSCYRYAAVVHVKQKGRQQQDQKIRQVKDEEWVDFTKRGLDCKSLQQQLSALSSSSVIAVSNIPYSKTIVSRCLVESLDDVAAEKLGDQDWLSSVHEKAQRIPSFSATDLVELAQGAGCQVEISWSRQKSQHGGLDAIFHQCTPENGEDRVLFRFPTDHAERPLHSLSSKPLQQQDLQRTQQQLREMLQDQLPAYMVPQTITVLDAMPLNQNGKVDRNMLAQLVQEQTTARQESVQQPISPAEQKMQQLWARVLNIELDSFGLDDSFFRLGGDSIAAMKLVGEARRTGLQLSVADIFRHPRLIDLASLKSTCCSSVVEEVPAFSLLSPVMKDAIFSVTEPFGSSLPIDDVTDVVPASYIQEFYIAKGVRAPREAFNYFFIDLSATVDIQVLQASCSALLNHFPILRTHFIYFQGKLYQVIPRHQDLPFSIFEVNGALAEESQAIYMRDLDQTSPLGLPTSFTLVRNASGMNRLIIRLSHAQYDGVCMPVIWASLASIYQQEPLLSSTGFYNYLAGEEDVVYGLVVAGRNSDLPGITELVGPCLNFVPVRARPYSTRTSEELLQSIQDQYISLGESDSMGLDDIVQHCTDWPANSEFDSIVQHQNIEEQPEIQFAREITKLQWFENPFAVPRQLSVLSQPRGDNLTIAIGGNTGILTDQCTEKLLTMLCDTILQLSGNLETRLAACKSFLSTCL
ncbi:hypothetical protein CFE70_003047 [Pyrenophora teres f. teres 0-1]